MRSLNGHKKAQEDTKILQAESRFGLLQREGGGGDGTAMRKLKT
jgi:hypothetical protein